MTEWNEDLVRRLLAAFYAKVRRDAELGPVFDDIIGDRWPAHMMRIEAFWFRALQLSRGYHGPDFMPAHLMHGTIKASQLERWLALFADALNETVPQPLQAKCMHVARSMVDNLRLCLDRRDT